MIIIDVSNFQEEIDLLEEYYYEIEGYKDIIYKMISNEILLSSTYDNYWNKYLEAKKNYDILKKIFYINHLSDYTEGKWSLDFLTKKVIIIAENEE